MDYYKVLELHKSATKSEIKQAFRKLAVKYHPDKHTSSNKSVKDNAIHKFKQISEAYEVLSDDRKRADYNLRSSGHGAAGSGFSSAHSSYYKGYGYGYGYGYQSRRTNYEYKYYYSDYGKAAGGFASRLEITLNYLTSRSFLFNAVLAGTILGGAVIIDKGRGVLWKLNNSGKSFEDAMDSIEKAKAVKDDKK